MTRQENECRQLAERNGWTVERVYTDNDRSATRGVRPAWRELVRDVEAGAATTVIAWHTDRMYRRVRDMLDLVDAGIAHGLRIETVTAGSLDLSTAAGRMVATQLAAVAGYEGEQKSARQKSATIQRAEAGNVGWTRRPYGYERNAAGKVVIVRHEAAELRKAAQAILSGSSVAAVVRDLNARNVPTSTGARWVQTTLTRLLVSPRYAGRAVSNGTDYGPGQWTAIFDTDTAERITAKLSDPRRRTAPASLSAKYLLSGLLTCGKCGGKMYAAPAQSPSGGRWMIYKCRTTHLARRLDLVDQVVEALIVARMSRPDAARLLAADVDVTQLRLEVTELRDRRDALAAMLAGGLLSAPAVREQAEKLTASISEHERAIEAASGSSPLAPLATSDDVAGTWQAMPIAAQRESIRALFESITVLPAGRGTNFDPAKIAHVWRAE